MCYKVEIRDLISAWGMCFYLMCYFFQHFVFAFLQFLLTQQSWSPKIGHFRATADSAF